MIDAHFLKRDDSPKAVFNPLRYDFVDEIRDDDNKQRQYTIRSMEIETFPAYLAKTIIIHLMTAVQNERGTNPLNEKAVDDIRKEIEVSGL